MILPPAIIMIAGGALVLALPTRLRGPLTVVVPMLALAQVLWALDPGDAMHMEWLTLELMPLRVDKLSLMFGLVFAVAALLGGLYAWHKQDRIEQSSALLYAGSALGIVFAGDLLTLFLFWEIMAGSATLLVWAGSHEKYAGSSRAIAAATRYLFVHLVGGALLLAGILWHLGSGGGLMFEAFSGGPAAWLILTSFAFNAAIPPLNAWLTDAYPEASVTGTVFLSA
jgi:multicomponent Na+:H+ antiporter subunit D